MASSASSTPATSAVTAPIGLTLVVGGEVYIQKAWWFDGTVAATAAIAKFKAAHAVACQADGFDALKIRAEQELFDTPMIFGLEATDGRMVSPSILPTFLCNAVRLGVTTLPPAEITAIAEVAAILHHLDDYRPEVVNPILAPLPRATSPQHKCAMSQVLGFMLNIPNSSDAFLYCVNEDVCVIVSAALQLDQDKVAVLGRATIPKPKPEQKCESRLVCFWCGISPLGRGVKLSCCGKCGCVAYCGADCQRTDWVVEHHRECKRTEAGVHPNATATGIISMPCDKLNITRTVTEVGKPTSLRAQVSVETDSHLSIRRLCSVAKDGSTVPLPMAWELR